jgi:ribA/ribD-fused uncharacterized protein
MPTDWSARTAAIEYFEKLVKQLKRVNDDDKELYEAALHALRRSQDHTAIQTKLTETVRECERLKQLLATTLDGEQGIHVSTGAKSRDAKLFSAHDVHAFTAIGFALRKKHEADRAAKASGPLKLDTDRQVFFYEQDHYYLSNFSAFQVRLVVPDHDFGGERCIDFDTSEIAYHWFKFESDGCEYEGDHHVRGLILSARSSHEAFKIAEKWRDHRRPDWDNVKVGIMRDILSAKVGQHEYVYRKLLETGDRDLIENSWRDDFWGWGPNRDGQNMLGKLWMEIRAKLREQQP